MKLKDVEHYDGFFKETEKFNTYSNRFVVFDRNGNELSKCYLEDIPNYLDLDVIETCESSYSGYFVGFKTTHIKLDVDYDRPIHARGLKYGEEDDRM